MRSCDELRRLRRPGAAASPEAESVGPHPRPASDIAGPGASAAEVAQALLTGRFTAAPPPASGPGWSGGDASATAPVPATTLDGPAPDPAGEPSGPPPSAEAAPPRRAGRGRPTPRRSPDPVATTGRAWPASASRPPRRWHYAHRQRHPPPRHQALQPPARPPGDRLGDRLRVGQGGGRGRPDPHRRYPGHAAATWRPSGSGVSRTRGVTSTRWA